MIPADNLPPGALARPDCPLCRAAGTIIYEGLADRIFGAPGLWTMRRCPAATCGTLWLDPRPSEDDLAAAYAQYYTHRAPPEPPDHFLRRVIAWVREGYYGVRFGYPVAGPASLKKVLGLLAYVLPAHRDRLDMRIMFLPAIRGGRLLDVGCGSGAALAIMRSMGWQVEGVDLDPRAVEVAHRLGIDARVGTVESQRYPDASFDAIMMSHLIEHVLDPASVIAECHRILRPGGRLGITTPNAESRGHGQFRERWRGLEPPRHVQIFTARSLTCLAKQAGFQAERLATSPRLAAMIHRESLDPHSGSVPRAPSSAERWFSFMSYVGWFADPASGEELALVAVR